MTRPGIEPRSPGPLANTLTAGPMSRVDRGYSLENLPEAKDDREAQRERGRESGKSVPAARHDDDDDDIGTLHNSLVTSSSVFSHS